ncbi:TPA: hypothetical protein QCO65_001191 [Bacillus cereus]|uniref:hypothetical protein n=1 Tax=Bacillus sp. FSL H8-0545 TaxID=2921402 RepID=UPI0030F932F8|nr:hypothetical protein [Bacillus cereus]HDR7612027.1 hypothetical protein [Bacillus mycoides]
MTRFDFAFSRDNAQKVSAQHKMLEHSKELFEWVENRAYFYVWGDKEHMAKDVNEALITVIEKEGTIAWDEGKAYLKDIQRQGYDQPDVY